mmetsp:Transcript_2604/g.5847  ORF Transcript_2604/g.5847 Transcript_2604/m.5847 type:complete len:216 (+) Transcript_2604:1646-2293(+)
MPSSSLACSWSWSEARARMVCSFLLSSPICCSVSARLCTLCWRVWARSRLICWRWASSSRASVSSRSWASAASCSAVATRSRHWALARSRRSFSPCTRASKASTSAWACKTCFFPCFWWDATAATISWEDLPIHPSISLVRLLVSALHCCQASVNTASSPSSFSAPRCRISRRDRSCRSIACCLASASARASCRASSRSRSQRWRSSAALCRNCS